jgi:hypothetical protein
MAQVGTGELRDLARSTLDRHWVSAGYAAPNATVYPWQWLWDSCFHALIWAELGDGRAAVELATALSVRDDVSGFVPHMNYVLDPAAPVEFWGRRGASSITQPPMYGHAVAELVRRGVDVDEDTVVRAERGIRFLLEQRRRSPGGLIELCHPWESGCDDSPRWDDLCPHGWEQTRWRAHKGTMVASIERSANGAPVANDLCAVGSVGFNALVAFNARELAGVTGTLLPGVDDLVDAIAARWDDALGTWVDDGASATGSGRVRTSDALLAMLVVTGGEPVDRAARALVDPDAFGGACGPWHVHRDEPTRSATTYWRGPAWPQLSYLLWLGLGRHDRPEAAAVGAATRAGALASGFAEYWHADTGDGLGAIPQSWTGVALLMSGAS